MRREKALFDGSRLYRQAREGSLRLIDVLTTRDGAALRPLAHLVPTGRVVIETAADLSAMIVAQADRATALAAGVSAYHALPVLAETTDQTYFGPEERRVEGLGPALKTAHALAYRSVFESAPHTEASIGALASLVRACIVLDALIVMRMQAQLAPPRSLWVDAAGIHTEPSHERTAREFERAFVAKGRVRRMANATIESLCNKGAIGGVLAVLAGARPSHVPELTGTMLGSIPDTNREFWGGLSARLMLMLASRAARREVTDEQHGMAILGTAGFQVAQDGIDMTHLQAKLQETFWSPPWRVAQPLEALRHLVVRRPAQRIATSPDLFVTTLGGCVDSITTWVEDALFREPWVGDAALSGRSFQQLVSAPFEEEAAALFRRHGFVAGRVTHQGVWLAPPERRDLAAVVGASPPGEIDVLAVHRYGYVIVAECKVLALPFESSRLRNVASKLSPDDAESFRSKLRRKTEWVRRLGRRLVPTFDGVLGVIVLDRFLPGAVHDAPELVADLSALDQSLAVLAARPDPRAW